MIEVLKQALDVLLAVRDFYRCSVEITNLRAAIKQLEEAEPMAWQHRQRGLQETEWQEWKVVSWKPQGPESSTFQMRPLYTAPVAPVNAIDEELVADANRYRYMRTNATLQDRNGPGLYWYLPRGLTGNAGEKLDAAIDSAMQGDKP